MLESDISLSIVKHELELVMRLNCAAHEGDFYQLKRLIEAGADPSKRDYDGRSPLVLSLTHFEQITSPTILSCSQSLTHLSLFDSLQHIAASRGYEKITEFLIEQGLDVNIAGKILGFDLLNEYFDIK